MKKYVLLFSLAVLVVLTACACSADYTVSVKKADFMCAETAWADFNVPENAARLFETEFAKLESESVLALTMCFAADFSLNCFFSIMGFVCRR